MDVLVYTCITLIAVQGVYILTGLTGLFSFGQAGFMAVGAYVSAMLALRLNLPFVPALTLGVLAAALLSLVVGYPTLKLKIHYFALATLGLAEAIRSVLNIFVSLTGGATGVAGIPPYTQPWMAVLAAVLSVVLTVNFARSRHGRACVAVRTDEVAALAIAVNAQWYRQMAFTISACLAGLAGGLMAFYISYIEPNMFDIVRSVELIIIVFFGGLRSITGSVLATILLSAGSQFLQSAEEWRTVIYSVLILAIIIFRPEGLLGYRELTAARLRRTWARLRGGKEVSA